MNQESFKHGFTLIELLLVITVIFLLASFILVALKPQAQFAKSNDIQRRADVNSLMNAIWQYTIDNNGNLPGDLNDPGVFTGSNICLGSGAIICSGFADIWEIQANDYINAIPGDPKFQEGVDSKYFVTKSTGGILTISAPECEQENCSIEIIR